MKNRKNLIGFFLVGIALAFSPVVWAITTEEIWLLNNKMGPVAKKTQLGTLINSAGGGQLNRGFIYRGNASNQAAAYDANDSGKILVGDGTDLVSVAVSGDATLASSGALTIAAGAISNSKVDASAAIDFSKLASLSRGFILRGNASSVAAGYDANDSGKILVGDGTDLISVSVSGDATLASSGALTLAASSVNSSKLADDSVVNADVNSAAAIDFSKLASLSRGFILRGNASNVATAYDANDDGKILVGDGTDIASVAVSGDIGLTNAGVTAISSGVIVNDDVNASAAIAFSKLAGLTRGFVLRGSAAGVVEAYDANDNGKILVGDGTDIASVAVSGDIGLTNAGVTSISSGVIVDDDVNASAAISFSKLAALIRGFIITGQTAGNVPTALDANDSGKILVGDGTDLNSVAVSGDATLASSGALTIAANAVSEAKMAAQTTDGLHGRRVAIAHYDFASDGGVQGAINLGALIPTGSVIEDCYLDIITGMTSAGGTGTIRIGSEDLDDDILASVDADTLAGFVQAIPTGAVGTFIKTTAARQLKLTIGVENLTAGKFAIVCDYSVTGT